ncbi:hypothetical protein PF004_g19663 [Phytophthora fragariae]|uniref:Uncharacterized protein n=1 Tax=Phytophthora fragariae TaxID=53985 RepID=A0A6G0N863_9STRA|nr:hypothetical protein PF004_g19663 [Phytophthora fragariae]
MKAALKGRVASSDAYALIAVAGKKVAWTLERVWSDTFFFRNVRPDKLYQLDKDGDDALDQTQFTVTNTDAAETTFELPTTRKEKEAGAIVLKVNSHAKKVFGDGKLQQYDRGPLFRTISVPEVKQLKKFTEIGLTKVAEDADYMIAIKPETDCDVSQSYLSKLKEIFENNFSGISVEDENRDNEKLKKWHQ